MSLKSKIQKLIPPKYIFKVLHWQKTLPFLGGAALKSYSGNGEDIILLNYLFKNKKNGFYVDVGAFHPKIISNTYQLNKKGWRGINIDPNPQSIELFKKYRKNDINLQIGISEKNEVKTYHNFSYSGANTFDDEFAKLKTEKTWNTLLSKESIECFPLFEVFEKYLPSSGQRIDLLDIDVEGLDLEVLKSNNWNKYRPSVILVEDKNFRKELSKSEVYEFLVNQGYKLHSYMDITLVMVDKDFKLNS
ncbi:FkbM family methyltransferase [Candidatus Nomurabacteria bacterium]|nr:FkbM family methyltransferase [Candidatus Nomurabacteria bacterium]